MAYKLKITLDRTDPKIYRTVIVPENFNFHQLHIVIQCVMNWNNMHLYQFNIGAPYASDAIKQSIPDEDDFWGNRYNDRDAETTFLRDFFNGQKKKMNYIYDFGDDWRHIITVLKKPKEEVLFPKCIKGENAAPIDDCGAIWGFYELLEASHKKRKSSEEKQMLEWYGISQKETYEDVYGFDIEDVNELLLETFR